MPRSRRWQSAKANAKQQKKTQKTSQNKTTRNKKIFITIGIIAVAAILISAFIALTPGLFSGTPSTKTIDWNQYNGAKVRFMTSMGNITLQLRTDKPITTTNFLNLTNLGLYDNTIFHRVISGFMIQGGGIENATIPNIPDEIGTNNHNYNSTISMANTGAANSASSQFFINVDDNNNRYASFDTSYTVFGRVIDGMDIVMAISQTPTDANDKPISNITLVKSEVLT